MKFPFLINKRPSFTEYKYVRLLRLVNIFMIGLMAFMIFQAVIFVYTDIYQSIGRVESIILLKSELGTSAIDFERLQRVSAFGNKKYAPRVSGVFWDPFLGISLTTPSTATSTTPAL